MVGVQSWASSSALFPLYDREYRELLRPVRLSPCPSESPLAMV